MDKKDNIAEWTADETNEAIKYDPPSTAAMGISKLAKLIGSKAIMVLTDAKISECLKNPDWTYRHAGVHIIGIISEYCKDKIINNSFEAIMKYVIFIL